MKKYNFIFGWVLCFLVIGGLCSLVYAQNNVPTAPMPKSVLLEEYTGKGCGNCPDGAAVASTLKALRQDHFHIISIHAGSYADPGSGADYRTDYGEKLLEFAGEYGYPQATIDRHFFSEYSAAILAFGRSNWTKATKQRSIDTATVNLWAKAHIDATTRKMTIDVEAYYYKASTANFNLLNVALVQNHVIGYQNQGGENYSHEHMLRDLITGQWGDTIKEVRAGSSITRKYTYDIPKDIRGVEVDVRNLELVIFVTETKEEVMQAITCKPSVSGITDPLALKIQLQKPSLRYAGFEFPMEVRNLGGDTIKQIAYEANINDTLQNMSINCNIPPYQEKLVNFRLSNYTPLDINSVSFKIKQLNDKAWESDIVKATFNGPIECKSPLQIEIKTDLWGDEVLWYVSDREDKHIYDFGPYTAGEQTVITKELDVPLGVHNLVLYDTWWDGYLEKPRGTYKIKDAEGRLLGQSYEVVDKGDIIVLNVVGTVNNEQKNKQGNENNFGLKLYPLPAKDYVSLSGIATENALCKIELCDLNARILHTYTYNVTVNESFVYEIPLRGLPCGMYFLKVSHGNSVKVLKLTKN